MASDSTENITKNEFSSTSSVQSPDGATQGTSTPTDEFTSTEGMMARLGLRFGGISFSKTRVKATTYNTLKPKTLIEDPEEIEMDPIEGEVEEDALYRLDVSTINPLSELNIDDKKHRKSTKRQGRYQVVELPTGPKGMKGQIGIKLIGGTDRPIDAADPGIFISKVKIGSVAEANGLAPGDKIIKINDVDVTNTQMYTAKSLLKNAEKTVKLMVMKAKFLKQEKGKNEPFVFTLDQLQLIQDEFSLFDRRGVGVIYTKDVKVVLRNMGQNPTEAELDLCMNRYASGKSKISFEDFVDFLSQLYSERDTDDEILNAFQIFDREHKGHIRVGELRDAFDRMPGVEDIPHDEIDEIFYMADLDENGFVEYKDFSMLVSPAIELY